MLHETEYPPITIIWHTIIIKPTLKIEQMTLQRNEEEIDFIHLTWTWNETINKLINKKDIIITYKVDNTDEKKLRNQTQWNLPTKIPRLVGI
jgi:hypothetical protein